MTEAFRMMANAPRGDCRFIPQSRDSLLNDLPLDIQYVVNLLAGAARVEHRWMEANLIEICIRMHAAPPASTNDSWEDWRYIYGGSPAMAGFRNAERDEWIVISDDGYARPTEKLSNLVCVES